MRSSLEARQAAPRRQVGVLQDLLSITFVVNVTYGQAVKVFFRTKDQVLEGSYVSFTPPLENCRVRKAR